MSDRIANYPVGTGWNGRTKHYAVVGVGVVPSGHYGTFKAACSESIELFVPGVSHRIPNHLLGAVAKAESCSRCARKALES